MRNYWVFKTVSDEQRSYKSHDGYDDILASKYVYDSNVANSRQVAARDIIVIVDKELVLGYANITRIKEYPGEKEITRCPNCNSTNYEARKTKTPKYRCNRGHEFSIPKKGTVDITKYEAYYGDSFQTPKSKIPIASIKDYYNRGYNRNMSIQSISRDFFKNIEPDVFEKLKRVTYYIGPFEAIGVEDSGEYLPNENDDREYVNRQIKKRRGQQKFRNKLINIFNSKCCVTQCSIVDLLEAAHINPYKGQKDNHPSNGLLLRADIHILFDLDMVGIHPEKLTVHLNDEVNKDKYEELNGNIISGNISKSALQIRWKLFINNK